MYSTTLTKTKEKYFQNKKDMIWLLCIKDIRRNPYVKLKIKLQIKWKSRLWVNYRGGRFLVSYNIQSKYNNKSELNTISMYSF